MQRSPSTNPKGKSQSAADYVGRILRSLGGGLRFKSLRACDRWGRTLTIPPLKQPPNPFSTRPGSPSTPACSARCRNPSGPRLEPLKAPPFNVSEIPTVHASFHHELVRLSDLARFHLLLCGFDEDATLAEGRSPRVKTDVVAILTLLRLPWLAVLASSTNTEKEKDHDEQQTSTETH